MIEYIPDSAFEGCELIEEISLPKSVNCIGEKAFVGCEKLKKINLSETWTSIGECAFAWCGQLRTIDISHVDWLRTGVFARCESLTQVYFSDKLSNIGDFAFAWCCSLKEISLGEQLREIGREAFRNCSALREVRIPLSVVHIGDNAFLNCSRLKHIEISKNYQNDIERIFGKTEAEIVYFDTAGEKHIYKHMGKCDSKENEKCNGKNFMDEPENPVAIITGAIELLYERGYITKSLLQRELFIGYSHATTIIDTLKDSEIIEYDDDCKKFIPVVNRDKALLICKIEQK